MLVEIKNAIRGLCWVLCAEVPLVIVRFQGLAFVVFLAFFYHLDPFAIYRSIWS